MSEDDPTQEDIEAAIQLDERLNDEVWPALEAIADEEPNAFYAMFVNVLYMLFNEGWDPSELVEEVNDHYSIFVEQASESGEFH